ncbi:MAG: hypothetical protein F4053_09555 [Proteobacteria bacterium]|nr:hypothetical protein [Pseudomonadota bacterium]
MFAFLLLAVQSVAVAHSHEDATLHFVHESCLACHFGSSLDDAAASADACVAAAPSTRSLACQVLNRFGFGPRQAPNARAPPTA